jgi:hypothetical protein
MNQYAGRPTTRLSRWHSQVGQLRAGWGLAALAVLLAPACNASNAPAALTEPCTLNSDCSTDLICALGRCRQQCVTAVDCGPGGSCVADGRAAACQSAAEKNTPCTRPSDCPEPLACASDYRCRNLCFSDADCNVLGIAGRVCAPDSQGINYCAEPSEVMNDLLSVAPPVGAPLGTPVTEPDGGDSALLAQPVAGGITSPIGTQGGTLGIGDVSVIIPPGALDHEVVISIAPIDSPLPGSVGQAYELEPTGTQFSKPITVGFNYTSSELGGNPGGFAVSTVSDGAWQAISSPAIDSYALVISGTTTHFSPYALVAVPGNSSLGESGAGGSSSLPAAGASSGGASTAGSGSSAAGAAGSGVNVGGVSSGGASSSAGAAGTGTLTGCPTAPGAPASPVGTASSTNTSLDAATIDIVDGYATLTNSVDSGPLSTTYSASLSFVFTDYANASGYAATNKSGSRTLTITDNLSSTSAPPQFAVGPYANIEAQIAGYDSACKSQSTPPCEPATLTISSLTATRVAGSIQSATDFFCGATQTSNITITFDLPVIATPGGNMYGCCLP